MTRAALTGVVQIFFSANSSATALNRLACTVREKEVLKIGRPSLAPFGYDREYVTSDLKMYQPLCPAIRFHFSFRLNFLRRIVASRVEDDAGQLKLVIFVVL